MGRMKLTMLLLLAGLLLLAVNANAALCVWVNPDRDIKNFFPGANSYVTDVQDYTKAQGEAIEKRLGAKLDPDENEFKFYRVKKAGKVVGTVLTHQARGKYGAVQTVVGIGTDNKVIGVYVQRFREPVNLNKPDFLKQFAGKDANDPLEIGKDITAIEGYDKSCAAVAYSVKKILVVYAVLGAA
jgi:Na+-translocating ferredoxin:NAD+ oxidoreductase RnfG subunit